MKNLANIISLFRVFLSTSLLFFNHSNLIFILIYLLCGISDILDGYIARKLKIQSNFGAKIDSFADLFMFLIILYILITQASNLITMFLPIIIAITIIRIINITIVFFKYHTFAIIHTWGNKLTGILVFMLPLFLDKFVLTLSISIIAILSSVEEFIIHIFANKLDINKKSFFFN